MDSKLMEKMQICMKTLEDSQFFQAFLTQTETPQLSEKILKALGTESSMQMVICGLGNIGSNLDSQQQLSLALLMKRKFSWISNIEVFDPVITLEESRVLEALGPWVLLELPEKWEFIENCKQEYILAVLSFTKEFEIGGTTKPLVSGFANTSWQFFNPISESELQLRKFSFIQLSG
ncbi:hypothetical protein POM88_013478 [Heracleum sosnowskyi]|uniref:SRR1-like domain-containing protein n=1 Tax=Heracleum sosnowskyi TaxID=360622 RepID=A0AAD8J1X6_9APIA|nr:hypothetical protein POM88_013478 [Heracleum sosnowskyi]